MDHPTHVVRIEDGANIHAVARRLEDAGAMVIAKLDMLGVINIAFDGDTQALGVPGVAAVERNQEKQAL